MPARGSAFDFSIAGDELEQHRIQLERNLQHTADISLHLSSAPDESDVEFPRHISDPHSHSYSGMASFDIHPSRDGFDADETGHYQPWSMRTGDEEDGIHPFGETVSTVAHHASHLTLTAGLGGRGGRRDASMSGAEYDPDRPVNAMTAGIASNARRYADADSTKSKHYPSATIDFDPLVVDDTAELERILDPRPSHRPAISRSPQSSSSADSPIPTPQSPRPKLSDALKNATFSPKRPRSVQSNRTTPRSQRIAEARHHESPGYGRHHHGTPGGRNRTSQTVSYAATSFSRDLPDPVVNVNPPTPSEHQSEGSTFPRMAKGITREIEAARRARSQRDRDLDTDVREVKPYAHSTVRRRDYAQEVPLKEIANQLGGTPRPAMRMTPRSVSMKRVHLPDITGLTSAVESPSRVGLKYLGYDAVGEGEVDGRILATLGVVQAKLAHLESENSISRRRVRELESELEDCKKEVVKERTRLLDHSAAERRSNHARTRNPPREPEVVNSSRYQEVVEEKKALEALISTLQAHLSRLTNEIADHHNLLEKLKTLQERDSRSLKEKGRDVEKLRQEVERLSGEVEVLRGVVEEGLKERRDIREGSPADGAHEDDEEDVEVEANKTRHDLAQSTGSSTTSRSQGSLRAGSPFATVNRQPSRRSPQDNPLQESTDNDAPPFLDLREITRITEELEERRSERSLTVSHNSSKSSRAPSRLTNDDSGELSQSQSSSSSHSGEDREVALMTGRVASGKVVECEAGPSTLPSQRDRLPPNSQHERDTRQSQPRKPSRMVPSDQDREPDLPRVHGTHVERLFYAAPAHDPQTCTVCHKPSNHNRRHGSGTRKDGEEAVPDWLRNAVKAKRRARDGEDDEGFDEDSDEFHRDRDGRVAGDGGGDTLPPQTVLVKVLKELEDDFTHYKFIYIELADQYKAIDATSNVAKRNVLAEHLQDVIRVLERKGDQIASLHGLLSFKDKPITA